MPAPFFFRRSLVSAAVLVLAACGGGGSDTPEADAAPSDARQQQQLVAPFTLSLASTQAVVFQGGTAAVRVRVARSGGFTGAVTLALSGLPAGVTASPAIIPAGATEAPVTLLAQGTAAHSLPTTVTVQGSAQVNSVTERTTTPLTVTVRGVAGMVDTSFAGGAPITPVGTSEDYAHAVAVQADGKVLVAGSTASSQGTRIAVVRYLRDGTLDSSFGVGGKAVAAVGSREDAARAIAVQADGRIVVAGHSYQGTGNYDFTLVRFLPNGTPDTTFGSQGRVLTDFGGDNDRALALLVMPDGRIVAGGQTNLQRGSTGVDFALARYLPDGRPDTTFGGVGRVTAPVLRTTSSDLVRGLALQTVGGSQRLLAVGGEGDFTVARFTETGALDTTFGDAGKVWGLFNVNIGSAAAVTVLPTGEAVVAGHIGHDFAAVRLLPSGQLDTRFGPTGDGRFRHAVSATNWDEATAIARQSDGRLLLGGWVYAGTGTAGDFGVLRLTAEGRLDTGFGQGGVMTHAVAGSKTDMGRGLVLQPDSRVPATRAIVAGEAQATNRDFALMRVWL